jgi:hypothetical protein
MELVLEQLTQHWHVTQLYRGQEQSNGSQISLESSIIICEMVYWCVIARNVQRGLYFASLLLLCAFKYDSRSVNLPVRGSSSHSCGVHPSRLDGGMVVRDPSS